MFYHKQNVIITMDYHDIKRQYSGWRAVDYRNQLVDVFMQIKRGDDSATMKLVIIESKLMYLLK